MTDKEFMSGILAFASVAVLIIVIATASYEYDRGYKQGQIDALNGSIHWQLQRQADGQMLWVECDGVCANSAEGR